MQVSNVVFMTNLLENLREVLYSEAKFQDIPEHRVHVWVNSKLKKISKIRLYNFAKSIKVRKICKKINETNNNTLLVKLGVFFSRRFNDVLEDVDLCTVKWCILSALYLDYGANTSRLYG